MTIKHVLTCALALLSASILTAQSGVTASGAKYTVLQPGSGPSPKAGQDVSVHAEAFDDAGQTVFSSRDMGLAIHLQVGNSSNPVSKARDEVMMQMNKGCKYREEIPYSLLPAEDPDSKKTGYMVAIVELLDVMDAKPVAADLFVKTAEASGIPAAEAEFNALQQQNPQGYTFFEWDLNRAGYQALQAQKTDLAIALFTLNTRLYPASANTYDSLGDAYAAKGDKEKAKISYQKAVQLNPKFTASQEKLEKL